MHQIAPFKKNYRGKIYPEPPPPLTRTWLRHASRTASRHATRPNSNPPWQILHTSMDLRQFTLAMTSLGLYFGMNGLIFVQYVILFIAVEHLIVKGAWKHGL